MQHALTLAKTALGKTYPNPAVGCVIVKQGKVAWCSQAMHLSTSMMQHKLLDNQTVELVSESGNAVNLAYLAGNLAGNLALCMPSILSWLCLACI